VLLNIGKFKHEKFGFFKVRGECLRIVQFDFVIWIRLELIADFGVATINIRVDVLRDFFGFGQCKMNHRSN